MRILILSDSLALPRKKPEACNYEDTWPVLIKRDGYLIHQVSIGGATSSDLYRQCVYHESFNPDVVIIQVGIVDCSPRFLSKFEQQLLKKIPRLGKWMINALNTKWVRKKRKLTYVGPRLFEKNIRGIINYFKHATIILIEIACGVDEYEEQLPGIIQNSKAYNNRLANLGVELISLESISEKGMMSDYHHLNKIGHEFISHEILSRLKKISNH